jgi:uncharacterized protein
MTNYHHGPEVIENFDQGAIVRDVKAATVYLVGTSPVLVNLGAGAGVAIKETDVVIRSKADAIAAFGPFDVNYSPACQTINQALHAIFNKDRGRGVGTIIVRNVFDPNRHSAQNPPTAADIIGGIDGAGNARGLEGALYTYGKLGYFPRRIIAPGFSTALGVRQKMLAIANRVRGQAVCDLPLGLTKQAAIELRGIGQAYQTGDERLVYCWPHVHALDPITGGQSLQPMSQHFVGVWNEVINREEGDDDGGVSASPSNRKLPDVSGLEVPLTYYPGDYSSDTNFINEAGIVTANMGTYGDGIKTWGAHASSWGATGSSKPTDWLHIRAMYDVLHEAIQWALMPHVDRRGTVTRVEFIEDQVQRYINTKERDGWIYGGRFRFDRAKNTTDEILGQGRFHYRLDSAPMAIMHRITVESFIDINLIRQALSLGGNA